MTTAEELKQKLASVFEEYQQLKSRLRESITQTGKIPRSICERCITAVHYRRFINDPNIDECQLLDSMVPMLQKYQITAIEPEFESEVCISSILPIPRLHPSEPFGLDEVQNIGNDSDNKWLDGRNRKVYRYIVSLDNNIFGIGLITNLIKSFSNGLNFCQHTEAKDIGNNNSLQFVCLREEYPADTDDGYETLWQNTAYFTCPDCRQALTKHACPKAFEHLEYIYRVHNCKWQDALLLYCIDKVAKESHPIGNKSGILLMQLLEGERVLVFLHSKVDNDLVASVKPAGIILFGSRSDMIRYLGLGVNILCIADDQYHWYNPQKEVMRNIDEVVKYIVKQLETYYRNERGNDHSRYIAAMAQIGADLGFVYTKEYRKKGMSLDCVWFNRDGTPFAAIEVETNGNFKKDIVSTWELEPEIAIVLFRAKTDSCIQELTNYALLKKMPHPFIAINTTTSNLYEFENHNIILSRVMECSEDDKTKLNDI